MYAQSESRCACTIEPRSHSPAFDVRLIFLHFQFAARIVIRVQTLDIPIGETAIFQTGMSTVMACPQAIPTRVTISVVVQVESLVDVFTIADWAVAHHANSESLASGALIAISQQSAGSNN